MFGMWLPGIVCSPGICSEVTRLAYPSPAKFSGVPAKFSSPNVSSKSNEREQDIAAYERDIEGKEKLIQLFIRTIVPAVALYLVILCKW